MKPYRFGDWDPLNVDFRAVEFVCNGTPMTLNRDEITVAAARMAGQVGGTSEIARRCRTHDRTIMRILRALGARACPGCYQLVFETEGIIHRHIDWRWLGQCSAAGRSFDLELQVAS